MNVLVACESSGVIRDAFLARGHNAFSCDLLPTESSHPDTYRHYRCDVRGILHESFGWDLMIGHPECTYLTLAGARWLYAGGRGTIRDEERWRKMREAAEFYNTLLNCGIPRICLENPVMHGHAATLVGKPTQFVQPWQFGHAETKKTGLRLINLPPLQATNVITPDFDRWPPGRGNGYEPKCHHASPGPDRWKERSRTLTGLGAAMAEQWGSLLS